MDKVRSVTPAGFIYTQGKTFFLLSPSPVATQDAWESGMMRWPVVPNEIVDVDKTSEQWHNVYAAPQHLLVHPSACAIAIGYVGKPIVVKDVENE